MYGFGFSVAGSLLVGLAPSGGLGGTFLMLGRICQGLSGVMPASLALVKAYWDEAERQRAISLWSMGSWGGSGFAALFGGLTTQNIGWRSIFIIAAIVSVIGMLMVRGTPESKAPPKPGYKFDLPREAAFFALAANLVMVAAAALSIMITVPKGRAVKRMEPAPAAGVAQPATQEK